MRLVKQKGGQSQRESLRGAEKENAEKKALEEGEGQREVQYSYRRSITHLREK